MSTDGSAYVRFIRGVYPDVLAAGSACRPRRRRGGGSTTTSRTADSGASARHPRTGLVRTTPMLFDLRSGGRRRTVKTVYLGLALLMFVGFVGFGIGSSGLGGGIGDAITGNGSAGGGDEAAVERLSTQVRPPTPRPRAPRPTRPPGPPSPRPASASPRVGDNLDPATGQYTAEGRRQLTAAGAAWDKYVALDPPTPDERLARQMAQAFLSIEQAGQGRRRPRGRDRDRARPSRPSRTWPSSPTRPASSARATSPPPRPSTSPPRTSRRTSRPSSTRPSPRPPHQQLQQAVPTPTPTAAASALRGAILCARALVAQLAEQRTLNPKVEGSIPAGGTPKPRYGAVSSSTGSSALPAGAPHVAAVVRCNTAAARPWCARSRSNFWCSKPLPAPLKSLTDTTSPFQRSWARTPWPSPRMSDDEDLLRTGGVEMG